jgi:tagatose-1,6-bisphosphate aldolase
MAAALGDRPATGARAAMAFDAREALRRELASLHGSKASETELGGAIAALQVRPPAHEQPPY